MKTVTGFIFLSSKITAGSDCSHEIKRHLLLGRKPMVNRNSVQFISVAQSCLTLCDPMNCSTPGFPVIHYLSLLKLMSIESVMPSNHLILCHPILLLPSIFTSIRVFSNGSALCIRWPKYWSFSISSSNEHSELISFRIETGLISLQSKGLSRVFSSFAI